MVRDIYYFRERMDEGLQAHYLKVLSAEWDVREKSLELCRIIAWASSSRCRLDARRRSTERTFRRAWITKFGCVGLRFFIATAMIFDLCNGLADLRHEDASRTYFLWPTKAVLLDLCRCYRSYRSFFMPAARTDQNSSGAPRWTHQQILLWTRG